MRTTHPALFVVVTNRRGLPKHNRTECINASCNAHHSGRPLRPSGLNVAIKSFVLAVGYSDFSVSSAKDRSLYAA